MGSTKRFSRNIRYRRTLRSTYTDRPGSNNYPYQLSKNMHIRRFADRETFVSILLKAVIELKKLVQLKR
jgi:hypothetical protein